MGAIAGGAAVGYNAAESDKVTVVTLACTSRKEAVRWGQVISAGIEENEGRAGKFSSLRKGIKVDKQQKFKGLSGLFKRLHYRYNPMVPSTIVDMLAWLDEGAAGTLWGDSVLTRGMRVVGEQQCMDKYVPYRSVLGGARRTQVSVANTAPDVFLRAMFLGKRTTKTQSEARKFESCRVRTLGSLGPFKDIVLVSVPSTVSPSERIAEREEARDSNRGSPAALSLSLLSPRSLRPLTQSLADGVLDQAALLSRHSGPRAGISVRSSVGDGGKRGFYPHV